jgi:5-methylcytosine-specific restriction endonuclease McrA
MSDTPEITTKAQARERGLKTYFTGTACGRGHLAPRAVSSGDCTVCRDARVRDWNEANRQRRYEIRQKWRVENKDKERASQRAWAERNKEWVKAYAAKRYREHYKPRHRELMAKWKADHPIDQIVHSQNGRARRMGASGDGITVADYHAMMIDQCGVCAYCGEHRNRMAIDHVVPLTAGGVHDLSNTVLACSRCNTRKGEYDLPAFLGLLTRKRPGSWTASIVDVEHLLAADWRRASRQK